MSSGIGRTADRTSGGKATPGIVVETRGATISSEALIRVFICGSALRGQPDNKNLEGAKFLGESKTQPVFRLHAVGDGWHPGIYQVGHGGVSIPGEVYALTSGQYAHLEETEPPNMYAEKVPLMDGTSAIAFLYPKTLIDENGWPDISDYGGWVAYKTACS